MTLWMPNKKKPLYAPMLATFGGGSVRGFKGAGGGGVGQLVLLATRTNESTEPADFNSLITTSADMQSNNTGGWGPYAGADMLRVTPSVDCKVWGCTYGSGRPLSYSVSAIHLGVLNSNGSTILKQENLGSHTFLGGQGAGAVEWFLFTDPYQATANTTIQVGTAFATNESGTNTNSYSYSGGPSSSATNTSYSGASFTFQGPTYSGAPSPFNSSNGTSLSEGQCQFILVEV